MPSVVLRRANAPFAVLSLPEVWIESERAPVAEWLKTSVVLKRANAELAVLSLPVVLLESERAPVAVLLKPSVLLKRANAPLAVLAGPVVLLKSAPAPVAGFWSAVLARSVPAPVAVLKLPVVRLRSEYTNRIIVDAGGEAPKGEVPFRGVASRVASIWRRTDGLRLLRKREARKHQGNENGEKCPGLSDLS